MAKLMEREARGLHKGFVGKSPCLPPRFPIIPNQGSVMHEVGTGFYINQSNSSHNKSQENQKHFQKYACSSNMIMHDQPRWLEELLDDSEVSRKKGSHRRSASDSFTFQEKTQGSCTFSNILEGDEFERQKEKTSNDVRPGGDQLTDLLEEIQQLHDQQNLPLSARVKPPNSNYENTQSGKLGASNSSWESLPRQLMFANETKSAADDGEQSGYDNSAAESSSLSGPMEQNVDTKRAKRQSAQRSRVRKLQYIADLERVVAALQTRASSLSPQVHYYKHQLAFLSVDNNALKHQIALFMREKRIKDSENDILMNEIQRLKKVHEYQRLHDQQEKQQSLQKHKIYRHSSLPADLGFQMSYGEAYANAIKNIEASANDSLCGIMNNLSLSSVGGNENIINSGCPDISGSVQHPTSSTRNQELTTDAT